MKITRFIRWATLLIAVPVLLLGIPKAASASTASSGTGWVRLAHLSPNTPAVDVYLYSFGDPSAELVLHHVGYGVVSPYETLAAGDYTVAMRAAGAAATTKPVLSASLTVAPGGAYTVAGLGPESGLRLQVLKDQLTTPPGKALVRVIQASLQQHVVTVTWNGQPAVSNLAFGSVSSYQAVSPATATLHVAGESETVELDDHARRRDGAHRSWSSTGRRAWCSTTSWTRPGAATRRRAPRRPGSAAPRPGCRPRCPGCPSSAPGCCSPWRAALASAAVRARVPKHAG